MANYTPRKRVHRERCRCRATFSRPRLITLNDFDRHRCDTVANARLIAIRASPGINYTPCALPPRPKSGHARSENGKRILRFEIIRTPRAPFAFPSFIIRSAENRPPCSRANLRAILKCSRDYWRGSSDDDEVVARYIPER